MPLEGSQIVLREQREDDLPFFAEMRNNLETQAWSLTLPPDYTLPMFEKQFREQEFSFKRDSGRFIIEEKSSGEMVGMVSYSHGEPRFSTMLGIMTRKKFWGKGYAYEAQEIILKFLFEELGLRVVKLYTHSGNPKAVKLAERSGFKLSCRQREAVFKNGQLFDNLLLDLLREEYYQIHPELTDNLPKL